MRRCHVATVRSSPSGEFLSDSGFQADRLKRHFCQSPPLYESMHITNGAPSFPFDGLRLHFKEAQQNVGVATESCFTFLRASFHPLSGGAAAPCCRIVTSHQVDHAKGVHESRQCTLLWKFALLKLFV